MPHDTPNSLIDSYEIEFAKESSGTKDTWDWYTVDTCGNDRTTTCKLDMKKVLAGDYNLQNGGNAVF